MMNSSSSVSSSTFSPVSSSSSDNSPSKYESWRTTLYSHYVIKAKQLVAEKNIPKSSLVAKSILTYKENPDFVRIFFYIFAFLLIIFGGSYFLIPFWSVGHIDQQYDGPTSFSLRTGPSGDDYLSVVKVTTSIKPDFNFGLLVGFSTQPNQGQTDPNLICPPGFIFHSEHNNCTMISANSIIVPDIVHENDENSREYRGPLNRAYQTDSSIFRIAPNPRVGNLSVDQTLDVDFWSYLVHFQVQDETRKLCKIKSDCQAWFNETILCNGTVPCPYSQGFTNNSLSFDCFQSKLYFDNTDFNPQDNAIPKWEYSGCGAIVVTGSSAECPLKSFNYLHFNEKTKGVCQFTVNFSLFRSIPGIWRFMLSWGTLATAAVLFFFLFTGLILAKRLVRNYLKGYYFLQNDISLKKGLFYDVKVLIIGKPFTSESGVFKVLESMNYHSITDSEEEEDTGAFQPVDFGSISSSLAGETNQSLPLSSLKDSQSNIQRKKIAQQKKMALLENQKTIVSFPFTATFGEEDIVGSGNRSILFRKTWQSDRDYEFAHYEIEWDKQFSTSHYEPPETVIVLRQNIPQLMIARISHIIWPILSFLTRLIDFPKQSTLLHLQEYHLLGLFVFFLHLTWITLFIAFTDCYLTQDSICWGTSHTQPVIPIFLYFIFIIFILSSIFFIIYLNATSLSATIAELNSLKTGKDFLFLNRKDIAHTFTQRVKEIGVSTEEQEEQDFVVVDKNVGPKAIRLISVDQQRSFSVDRRGSSTQHFGPSPQDVVSVSASDSASTQSPTLSIPSSSTSTQLPRTNSNKSLSSQVSNNHSSIFAVNVSTTNRLSQSGRNSSSSALLQEHFEDLSKDPHEKTQPISDDLFGGTSFIQLKKPQTDGNSESTSLNVFDDVDDDLSDVF